MSSPSAAAISSVDEAAADPPRSPSRSPDSFAGLSCSRTPLATAANCGFSASARASKPPPPPGTTAPFASASSARAAIAPGSAIASPATSVATSDPSVPSARSPSASAKSSSSRLSRGATASKTFAGDARTGAGEPPGFELGTRNGPGTSSGLGSCPSAVSWTPGGANGRGNGSVGGRGSCAKNRGTDFLSAWRSSTSSAVVASRSSRFLSASPPGLSTYLSPSARVTPSSGTVSRSTKTPSSWSLATTPMALLSITASLRPWRMAPPPTVEA